MRPGLWCVGWMGGWVGGWVCLEGKRGGGGGASPMKGHEVSHNGMSKILERTTLSQHLEKGAHVPPRTFLSNVDVSMNT